jgi:hypothetical protein
MQLPCNNKKIQATQLTKQVLKFFIYIVYISFLNKCQIVKKTIE